MSLKSFWNKPIFEYDPKAEKNEKERQKKASEKGCFCWIAFFAVVLIVDGIFELADKIRASEHPALIFSLIGVGLAATIAVIIVLVVRSRKNKGI